VTSLTNHIHNRPVLFALLKIFQSQSYGLVPSQSACQQQRKQGAVAFSFQPLMIGYVPKCVEWPVEQSTTSYKSTSRYRSACANLVRVADMIGT